MTRPLTPKQEKFCQLVAEGNTYAESYRQAYPTSQKWKNEAVWVKSSELMSKGNVLVRVKEIQQEIAERNQVTLQEVLEEMASWLRFDPLELFDKDNCVKEMSDIPTNVRKCLASPIQVTELYIGKGQDKEKIGEVKIIKFQDKVKVADNFMKKFGAYITKVKLDEEDLEFMEEIIKGIKE